MTGGDLDPENSDFSQLSFVMNKGNRIEIYRQITGWKLKFRAGAPQFKKVLQENRSDLSFCAIQSIDCLQILFLSVSLLITFDLQTNSKNTMEVPCLNQKNKGFVVSFGELIFCISAQFHGVLTFFVHSQQDDHSRRHCRHYLGSQFNLLSVRCIFTLRNVQGMGWVESRVDLRERTHRYDMIDVGFIATQNLHDYLAKNQFIHDVILSFFAVFELFCCVLLLCMRCVLCRSGRCGTPLSWAVVCCMVCSIKRSTEGALESSCALFSVCFSVSVSLCVCVCV